jgi:four helix bundle protein
VAVKSYRQLTAWQRAMDLVVEVYKVTRKFPREEIYALTNQVRRAVVSVPSNIAEGQSRGFGVEFRRYLSIALGSLQEVETQLMIARRLAYIDDPILKSVLGLADEVGRLLRGLHKSVHLTSN